MSEIKAFPTEDVLGVITGRLLGDIGGIYEVQSWMTGESVFTHQLPRVSREATPVILAFHPHLQSAIDEAEYVSPDNWQEWRDKWIDRFGPEISVPKMSTDQHERIDPLSELVEKVHSDKIIVVET